MKWTRKQKLLRKGEREKGRKGDAFSPAPFPPFSPAQTGHYITHTHVFRACGRKKQFTKRLAQEAINHFNRTKRGRHGNAEALRAYPCPHCNHWHLTKDL